MSTFAGRTAELYAGYRRDLPADQALALAGALGLGQDDRILDLGCGTGQLGVPLLAHCSAVVAVDPEPQMLAGLAARGRAGVLPVLAGDRDLPALRSLLRPGLGAVVIGNALHRMDEPATLTAALTLLRPGGAVAVVTQGPPLWLGPAEWQQDVHTALEHYFSRPLAATCGSDAAPLERRRELLRSLGTSTTVLTHTAEHTVDADWVLGHLGSAMDAQLLDNDLMADLRRVLARHDSLTEVVTTTAVVAATA